MENNAPQKKQLPAFLILTIIAVVAAVVLALTNMVTAGPIAEHAMAALKEAFNAVMPAESYEQMTVPADYEVSSLYAAKNGDEVIGYCVTASGTGYGGPVAVTLGVDMDGVVTGCSVGDTSFAETAGFGMRAKEPSFQDQFPGISAIDGGSFEALSGATVTSEAVRAAVNKGLRCVAEVALQKTPAVDPLVTFGAPAAKEEKPAAQPLTGAVQEGSAKGFASDVKVQLTVEGGVISALTIDSAGETEGFGTRCAEDEAFIRQFVGQAGPFTLGENVDALSGATVTSTAVVEAVNAALAAPAAAASGETVTGTAKGFQSDVTVTLTVENGAIASIMIDSAAETEGFGTRCAQDEAFQAQFVGKSAPLTLGENIDALSGATVTSTAVVEAANAALANVGAAQAPATVIAEGENATLAVNADGAALVTPAEGYTGDVNVKVAVENGKVTAGEFVAPVEAAPAGETFIGKAPGFQSDVTVTLTVDAGVIASIKVDSAGETTGFGTRCAEDEAFLNQFVGKKVEVFKLGENVDALSGATVTSQAVVDAINASATIADSAVAVEEAPADTTAAATAAATATTEEVKVEEAAPAAEEAAPAAETLTATAPGFVEKDVGVSVTLNEDGTIATLTLDLSQQVPPVCDLCNDEAFLNQFIGKKGPFEGVDIVTGATFTSNGVIEALNSLFPAEETAPAAEEAAPAAETLTATAPGFVEKDVGVKVTLNEDGTIATLTLDLSQQVPPVCDLCNDEAFLNQFIGKKGPFEGVDIVTGATFTSNGVIEALNSLFPVEETAPAAEELTGTAAGFQSDVTVTLTVADGVITGIKVDSANETPGFGTRCAEDEAYLNQFIGKKATPDLGEGIDALSGATMTSEAVVKAANAAIGVEEAVVETAPAAEEAAPAVETLTAVAPGFLDSDVGVSVTLNEDGTIATLTLDLSKQVPPVCDLCNDEAFLNQFIGKKGPFEGVDIVTGATFTSNGVIEALNSLFQ